MRNILISAPNNHEATVYLPVIYGILKNYYHYNGNHANSFNWLSPIYKKEYSLPEEQVDVLGLSCYAWNASINYEIARLVKERNPKSIVIAGGPEVDYKNPNFFKLHPYVDAILIQDGEISFTQILDKIANNDYNFNNILGVMTRTNKLVSLPMKPTNFAGVISEYTIDEYNSICQNIIDKNHKIAFTLETDRGCPYGCTFCDWGSNTMNKIRKIDLDLVYKEIEWAGQNKVNALYIANANFGIFPRDIEIAKKIAEVKNTHGYPKIVQTNYTKNHAKHIVEIIKIFNDAKLIDNFSLSIQTTSESALKTSNRTNLPDDELEKIINLCNELQLPIRPQIILGMPGETLESYKQTFEDLMVKGIYDNFCVFPFEMLVNAPANEESYIRENGLITKNILSKTYHSPKNTSIRTLSSYLVATNTYSITDYIEMLFFSTVTTTFIGMGFSRLPIKYLAETNTHIAVIDKMIAHFLHKKDSTLGKIFNDTYVKFSELSNADNNIFPEFEIPVVDYIIDADEYIMAQMYLSGIEVCFDELEDFYRTLCDSEEFLDLCKYQRELVISPDFDPNIKKSRTFNYDWHEWSITGGNPKKSTLTLEYYDSQIGSAFKKDILWHKYPNNTRVFLMQTLVSPSWRCNILLHQKINKYYNNMEK